MSGQGLAIPNKDEFLISINGIIDGDELTDGKMLFDCTSGSVNLAEREGVSP